MVFWCWLCLDYKSVEKLNNPIIKYRKMAKKYHPDKVPNLGAELRKQALEKFQVVSTTYKDINKEREML